MGNARAWSWLLVVGLAACGGDPPASGDVDGGLDAPTDAPPDGDPTAAELMDRIATCDVVGGMYANGGSEPANVSICGLPGAVFWKSDLDIDCDGKMSTQCNSSTDPSYQNQTAATDSMGDPLDAATLPFVVIPGISTRFDYRAAGLRMGSIVAVIYQDKVVYGPLGDVGPTALIGEASYRMAELLGIDPDPATGGIESGVSYIAFTGTDGIVDPIEDHDIATALGIDKAKALLGR